MDLATVTALIIQITEILFKYGPNAIPDFKRIWANIKLTYESIAAGEKLTPEQLREYDENLAAVLAAEQAAFERQQAQV